MVRDSKLKNLIKSAAQAAWGNEESLSNKNRHSIPEGAREGFAVIADVGGVCVLDPSGKFRIFLHRNGTEVPATKQFVRASVLRLRETHPQISSYFVDV